MKQSCCNAGLVADIVPFIKKHVGCVSSTMTDLKAKLSTGGLPDPTFCTMSLDITLNYDTSISSNETLTNCSSQVQKALKEYSINITAPSHSCSKKVNISTHLTFTGAYCPFGYFKFASGVILCIPCTKGSYYNASTGQCHLCNYDTYQDEEAQGMCKPCPENYGTLYQNTISNMYCIPKCRKGEFNKNYRQLAPCEVCPIGYYADKIGASSCRPCDGNKTTASMGSTSKNDCRDRCPAGYFSPITGLSPCTPCPKGQYQNETSQKSCLSCPTNSTSYTVGSTNCTETLACKHLTPCQNEGNCTDQPKFSYECSCPTGYIGKNCETKIDKCSSNPCVFGNCTTLPNNYRCTCEPGYHGENCDKRDFCFVDPCKNNATCKPDNDSYTCVNCLPPYTGYNCDVRLNPCASLTPCKNGGNCSSAADSTSYSCACSSSFTGPNCETEIDFCAPAPCKNNGVCVKATGSYSCNCTKGWTGTNCEIDVNECETNKTLCMNNGTCVDIDGGYYCSCAQGFQGFNCSQMIDLCTPHPCHPTSNCSSNGIDYTCACAAGYEGIQCKKEINLCDKNPCDVNGTSMCEPSFNNFTCLCENGFKGRFCNETISYCTPNPCLFGAECIDGSDVQVIYNQTDETKFYCKCPWYRGGQKCEIQLDTCIDNQCANNATCINGTSNYTCQCEHGFNGTLCDNVMNLCELDKPCKNEGMCVSEPGNYVCDCAKGWTGKNCTEMVDNCLKKPCLNDGNCTNLLNDFKCTCTERFEGKTCSQRINVCLTTPCQNGGSCYDNATLESGFECICPPGFEGDLCETNIDDCPKPDPCENGAVCKDLINDYMCECPSPVFEGKFCNDTKSGDYDYLFDKNTQGLLKMITETITTSMNIREMSIQFWVRSFIATDSIYLRIQGPSGTLVEFSTKSLKFYIGGTPKSLALTMTDGAWTSILLNVHLEMLTLYINGVNVSQMSVGSSSVSNGSFSVSFGNVDNSAKPFSGQITKFFWSKTSLPLAEIELLKGNCSKVADPTPSSNITMDWRMMASSKKNSMPTQCGLSKCPAGHSGPTCALGEDTMPPTMYNCSSDLTIIKNVDLMEIVFPEPTFTDDSGEVTVVKSGINSGDNVRPGIYPIIRSASDAAGNEVICQFQVTFVKFQCEALTPPNNDTNMACSNTSKGEMFCQVSCKDVTRYAIPPTDTNFFSCTADSGGWTPRQNNVFTVSECVLSVPPTSRAQGSMTVSLPPSATCSARRSAIIDSFVSFMAALKLVFPEICKNNDCSDLKDTVAVNCPGARRRKRSTDVSLAYTLPPIDGASTSMCTAISGGNTTGGSGGIGVSAGACPTTNPTCQPGYFHNSGRCYACRKGSYMRNIYDTSCTPCAKGYYNALNAQSVCLKCPVNQTTPGVGATSTEFCYQICPAGKFFNPTTSVCESCPSGTYQSLPGQAQCSVCRTGQTSTEGAISCKTCRAGEQLSASGACVACPVGFYRPNIATNFVCAECPPNYTTKGTGSTKQTDCNVPICKAGEYRTNANVCAKCFIGTYQPNKGQTKCIRCSRGETTASTGATSVSDCKPGLVNECMVNSHNCDKHATCKDTSDYFECTCNGPNWVGDGVSCKCAVGYTGTQCEALPIAPPKDNSQVIGIAVGCSFAALVLIILIAILWYKCHYSQRPNRRFKEYQMSQRNNVYENESYDLSSKDGV